MKNEYLDVISLVERLHRHFLEVVKLELDGLGIHDINNVQGLMLFNIGDAEMTVGELTLRGCYLGSNVSYNVKKMVENGYLVQERSVHDRRSIHVRLTDKGSRAARPAERMHQRHVEMLTQTAVSDEDLQTAGSTLRRLERFWIRAGDLVQRPGRNSPPDSRFFGDRTAPAANLRRQDCRRPPHAIHARLCRSRPRADRRRRARAPTISRRSPRPG